MGDIGTQESTGDNLEFNVASTSDVTINFADSSNTSANDTATTKYTDTSKRRKAFCLRPNKAVQIISFNGVALTDPYSCKANGSITENWDTPLITSIVIRVITADTNLKLRVR